MSFQNQILQYDSYHLVLVHTNNTEISGLKFGMDLHMLILSRFLGKNVWKLKISELIMSEAWGWFGGGVCGFLEEKQVK